MKQVSDILNDPCELSDRQLAEIVEHLGGLTCLPCIDAYKSSCVKRRIAARIRRCGCRTVEQYLERLNADPNEAGRLSGSLSIHVSRFFRNGALFDVVQQSILPSLVQSAAGRTVRFWSVGCSAGQEPYSLAILLTESFGAEAAQDRFEILATDIDSGMLQLAERGWYDELALQGISPERRERFFTAVGQGMQLRDEVRRLVRFCRMDLLQTDQYLPADLVLCRNTLIYFNRPAQEKILHAFADILLQGGILVLGKSESMPAPLRSRFATLDPVERIYHCR